jgi:ferredoxin
MKVVVDLDLCEGHARCVSAAPAVFQVGKDDLVDVRDENVTVGNESRIELAVANCPRQALRLER